MSRAKLTVALFAVVLGACVSQASPPSGTHAPDPATTTAQDTASPASSRDVSSDSGTVANGVGPGNAEGSSASPPMTMVLPATVDDENTFMLDCMLQQGFAGRVAPEGGILFDTPPDQHEHYVAAIAFCSTTYRELAGMATDPPSTDELSIWYDALLLTYDCLVENGYPTDEPPTKDAWIESDGTTWHPYDYMMLNNQLRAGEDPTSEAFARMEETCPQDLELLIPMLEGS